MILLRAVLENSIKVLHFLFIIWICSLTLLWNTCYCWCPSDSKNLTSVRVTLLATGKINLLMLPFPKLSIYDEPKVFIFLRWTPVQWANVAKDCYPACSYNGDSEDTIGCTCQHLACPSYIIKCKKECLVRFSCEQGYVWLSSFSAGISIIVICYEVRKIFFIVVHCWCICTLCAAY